MSKNRAEFEKSADELKSVLDPKSAQAVYEAMDLD
jgi:hypothetical protein